MNGPSDQSKAWVRLKTGKEFSRLLYPNPVCFLSTIEKRSSPDALSDHGVPVTSTSCEGSRSTSSAHDNMTIDDNSRCNAPSNSDKDYHDCTERNVMILSWLTPTNNQGRFMFSINKARYSASLLAPSNTTRPNDNGNTISERCMKRRYSPATDSDYNTFNNYQTGIEFALSVPVQGMEEIVLDVGSISGRFSSKFPPPTRNAIDDDDDDDDVAQTMTNQLSNRQRKKLKKQHLTKFGVTGLSPVPLGTSSSSYEQSQTNALSSKQLFAIQGTVAHLKCRTYAIIGTPSCDISNKVNGNAKNQM